MSTMIHIKYHCTVVRTNPRRTNYKILVMLAEHLLKIDVAMDQISIQTSNPKCRLFLKIDQ
jgi:hypothetical protein